MTEMVLKLLKFGFSLGCLGLFVWWGLTVPLGERTLYAHIRAIGSSEPTQDLVRGTKQKVGEVTRRLAGVGVPDAAPPAAPPQEHITATDREQMKRLIKSKQTR
jgi:hypothetical protein